MRGARCPSQSLKAAHHQPLQCHLAGSSGTGRPIRRAALYCRVSTLHGQTTANQELVLREVADRMQCEIVALYTDQVTGAKGRDKRPGFDKLMKAAARHEFDLVMAWSV